MFPRIIEKKISPEPNSGCWLWEGSLVDGYAFGWNPEQKKNVRVHRLSYQKFRGEIPEDLLVCHTCDVRCCVNPDHLFLGTDRDNTDDKVKKGRQRGAPGEKNRAAKLTCEQVDEIRKHGGTLKEMSTQFGIHVQTVYRIRARQRWGRG